MKSNAILSEDRKYRYVLSRIWDDDKPKVLFLCLNPSTADENTDDRTVTRCINFAKTWGYGGLLIGNLFALRSTDSSKLYSEEDPVGPENDQYLQELAKQASLIIAAWGDNGSYMGRSTKVKAMFSNKGLKCFKINLSKEPKHPLYVSGDATLIDFV